jgi:hypothetical protein
VVIRESGDIHSIVETAILNGIPVTENIRTGTDLVYPSILDRQIADYYKAKDIYPATSMESCPGGPGGIGYMAVGLTFIVS